MTRLCIIGKFMSAFDGSGSIIPCSAADASSRVWTGASVSWHSPSIAPPTAWPSVSADAGLASASWHISMSQVPASMAKWPTIGTSSAGEDVPRRWSPTQEISAESCRGQAWTWPSGATSDTLVPPLFEPRLVADTPLPSACDAGSANLTAKWGSMRCFGGRRGRASGRHGGSVDSAAAKPADKGRQSDESGRPKGGPSLQICHLWLNRGVDGRLDGACGLPSTTRATFEGVPSASHVPTLELEPGVAQSNLGDVDKPGEDGASAVTSLAVAFKISSVCMGGAGEEKGDSTMNFAAIDWCMFPDGETA
eukprot:CAMPEP_0179371336 /NCGR_PEP_ID=MMETSP0797-20121207/85675_1 /TAXON_ID=47934 /ORGANISM="Dinophysis acuminata, Strain DAEP01" /LENGTH=307 /DNA_ID=CAMNT_0021087189 /DNA_START=956 /DNA_END=1875 /DNA_ORIENTATION=-